MCSSRILLFFALAASAFAQVYSVTLTADGTGFTSAPTVTATGGGCTSEPTFVATEATGTVNTVVPSFAGIGCTSAPALAFSGGGGTGATATAALLPATEVILSSVPTSNQTSVQPTVGGQYLASQFACWLTVPATRVPFYAAANSPYRMPGTTQITQAFTQLVPGFGTSTVGPNILLALGYGIITEYDGYVFTNSSNSIATAEALIVTSCGVQQTNLNAWDPWASFGTYYNLSGAWNAQGYQ